MSNFHSSMNIAPRDGRELLLLVCTGDPETPIAREVGWWDVELKRFEGDWRYYDSPTDGYAKAEPIGWAPLPEIDLSFLDLVKPRPKPKAKPKPPPVVAPPAPATPPVKPAKKVAAKKSPAPANNSASDSFDPL